MKAALLVCEVAPPSPLIWRMSGLPKTSSRNGSRARRFERHVVLEEEDGAAGAAAQHGAPDGHEARHHGVTPFPADPGTAASSS